VEGQGEFKVLQGNRGVSASCHFLFPLPRAEERAALLKVKKSTAEGNASVSERSCLVKICCCLGLGEAAAGAQQQAGTAVVVGDVESNEG